MSAESRSLRNDEIGEPALRRVRLSAILMGIVLSICPSALVGEQAPPDVQIEESIYTRGLRATLREVTKRWGQGDDSAGGTQIGTDWRRPIVEVRTGITYGMPATIGDSRVEYLSEDALIERYKKLRKDFPVIVINPMTTEGERLKIHYSIDWFRYEHHRPLYQISSWSIVYFRLDDARRQFVVDQVKLGGI